MAAVRLFLLNLFIVTLSLSPSSLSIPENEALLKLKQSFTNSGALSSWAPNTNPCADKWQGVICTRRKIIAGLRLNGMGLSGKIDVDALMEIRTLRIISFENNNFAGPLPDLHRLGALKAIFLSSNQFSGPIPADFFPHLGSLKKVWLNGNKLSGSIPESLANLNFLTELHLENNEFLGPIPPLKQVITSLNLSNNKLEGPIPQTLARFEAKSFLGNERLCGKPLERPCEQPEPKPEATPEEKPVATPEEKPAAAPASGVSWVTKAFFVIIGCAILAAILLSIKNSRVSNDDDFSVLSRDQSPTPVHVYTPSPSKKSRPSETSKKGGLSSESRKGGGGVRSNMGDLIMLNEEKGVFGMPDMMKASAEVLGNGGLGSTYKAAMAIGLSVVVKRMREMNKITRDLFDAEMRRFGRIRHENILTPLAYHYRREEKLLISEYMPRGSLLYVLHGDRGTSHAGLKWHVRFKIIQGIARGLQFLHTEYASCDLPHGNLKSSNVLLTQNYDPLLSDYAFYPLINNASAQQAMFAYKTPDFVQYQQLSHKTDVYCFGIIILEIMTGKLPSQYHSNKGGTDVVQWVLAAISEGREAQLIDPEIQNNSNSLEQMLKLLDIGAACTVSNPEQRISLKEAIRRIGEVQV